MSHPTNDQAVETSRRPVATSGDRSFAIFAHLALAMWALLVVGPMLWTLLTSFKTTN